MPVYAVKCCGRSGGKSGDCDTLLGYIELKEGQPLIRDGKDIRDKYLCDKCAEKEAALAKNAVLIGNAPASVEMAANLARLVDFKKSLASADSNARDMKTNLEALVDLMIEGMVGKKEGPPPDPAK